MEKELGVLSYINNRNDEAYLIRLHPEYFRQKFYFSLSEISFKPEFGLIVFYYDEEKEKIIFEKFEKDKHLILIDIDLLKKHNFKISFMYNSKLTLFLLDNNLCDTDYEPIEHYLQIKEVVDNKSLFLKKEDYIKDRLDGYEIILYDYGYDKPGDWSMAGLSIRTQIPFHSIPYEYDEYLQMLLPNFKFKISQIRDYKEYQFKSDLLKEIKEDFGVENLNQLDENCKNLSVQIRLFFKHVYNREDHWKKIVEKYNSIRRQFDNGNLNIS